MECNPKAVIPVGTIPTLGCCRPSGCRSWVQAVWYIHTAPGGELNALNQFFAFEASIDLVALYPFTANPPNPLTARRSGFIGQTLYNLNNDGFLPPSILTSGGGPCAASWVSRDNLGGDPVQIWFLGVKSRVLAASGSYCTVSREWNSTGALLPVEWLAPAVHTTYPMPAEAWVDIARDSSGLGNNPSGGGSTTWFDEFCDLLIGGT